MTRFHLFPAFSDIPAFIFILSSISVKFTVKSDRWSLFQPNCSSIDYSNSTETDHFKLDSVCESSFTKYILDIADSEGLHGIITPLSHDSFELCGAYNKIAEDLKIQVRSVNCQHHNFPYINRDNDGQNHKITDTFQEISARLAQTLLKLKWLNPVIITSESGYYSTFKNLWPAPKFGRF